MRIASGLPFLLGTAVSLLGCSGEPTESVVKQQGIIYCSEGAPEILNPQLVTSGTTIDTAGNTIYNRLLEYNPETGALKAGLAENWRIEEGGTVYRFNLRQGIKFHTTSYFTPSRDFNADDVLFSFNRILNPEHPYHFVSGGAYPFFQSIDFNNLIEDIVKENEFEVSFHLNHPDSSFIYNLATEFAVILSEEYAQQLITRNAKELIDTKPVGTGPFVLQEHVEGSYLRYYRHPDTWEKVGNIKQLVMDLSSPKAARMAKLITGECDVSAYPVAADIPRLRQLPQIEVDEATGMNVGYWAFNTRKPPFNNTLVRQALAHAIDKKSIIEAVYFGHATEAVSVLPPSSWAFDSSLQSHPYSPTIARNLLQQAGYENGFSMDIWAMPVQRTYNPNAVKMAELLQQNLANIGVKANIVSYEWSTFRRKLANGEHDSVLIGWVADTPDPNNFFTPLLSCASAITGGNRANWCSPQFDELLAKAVLTSNLKQRTSLYHQAQRQLYNEVPLVSIAHAVRYQAKRNDIIGVTLTASGGVDFSNAARQRSEP